MHQNSQNDKIPNPLHRKKLKQISIDLGHTVNRTSEIRQSNAHLRINSDIPIQRIVKESDVQFPNWHRYWKN